MDHDEITNKRIRRIAKDHGCSVDQVNAALDHHPIELDRDKFLKRTLAMELVELDELQAAFRDKALVDQDVAAGVLLIKVAERRATLLGLNPPPGVQNLGVAMAARVPGQLSSSPLDPELGLSEISPFHNHEPRDTAIPVLLIGVAGSWMRLIEIRERESMCEKFSHVRCERTMPVHDANARPFHPLGKLLEISIDAVV